MAHTYAESFEVSTCAPKPIGWDQYEAQRNKVIRRLAIKQERERLLTPEERDAVWRFLAKVDNDKWVNQQPEVQKSLDAQYVRKTPINTFRKDEILSNNKFDVLSNCIDEIGQDALTYDFHKPLYRPPKKNNRVKLFKKKLCSVMHKQARTFRSIILLKKLRALLWEFKMKRSRNNILEMYILDRYLYSREVDKAIQICELERRMKHIQAKEFDEVKAAEALVEMSKQVMECIPLEPQSDVRPEDPQLESVDQQVNTVLASEVVNAPEISMATQQWSQLCTGDYDVVLPTATDRWLQIDSFDWTKDAATSAGTIKTYQLPKDILKNCADIANLMGFRVSSLFTYDAIKIRAQMSSSPFDKGLINVSAQYGMQYMRHASDYDELHLRTQPMHAYMNAADSSTVELELKYNFPLPAMRTRHIESDDAALNQVTVRFDILSPLLQVQPSPVKIQVYIMFVNLRFTGMVHAAIANLQPQMFRTITSLLEKGLNFLDAPANCDNPPDPTPPMYVVPTGFHSWSFGTGVSEPIHALRLDARGQTPHPNMSVDMPFTVKAITQIPGYFAKVKVSKDSSLVDPIFCMDACPIPNRDVIVKEKFEHALSVYNYPPISIVSSCFAQWRGSIVVTGVIVCTVKERCKLRLCYIPGVPCSVPVTHDQAKVSPYAIVSIPEQQSFRFVIPYITDYPWYPRRFSGNYEEEEFAGPSSFRIYVENALVPMAAIANEFEILLHLSAGDDFELSVPVQPAFSLGWRNSDATEGGLKIQTAGDYFPYYAGTWLHFLDSQYFIFRHATTSGAVTPFQSVPSLTSGYYLKLENETGAPTVKSANGVETIMFGVEYSDYGYTYLVPVKSGEAAIAIAQMFMNTGKANFAQLSDQDKKNYLFDAATYTEGDSTWSSGNNVWLIQLASNVSFQSDEMVPCPLVAPTAFGNATFGENFNDLKDLCRRYQLYAQFDFTIKTTSNSGRVFAKIPLYWHGLEAFDKTFHDFRIRNSHLNLLLSGYAGMRGGLRVRIVTTSPLNLFVQHRPDRIMEHDTVVPVNEDRNAEAYYNHTYASYIQTKFIDQIEIEVPYYKPFVFGYNFQPNNISIARNATGLGYLYLGTVHPVTEETKISISIHTALADDAYPYIWRGFPRVAILDEIPSTVIPPPQNDDYVLVEPQGITDWALSRVTKTVENKTTEVIDDVSARINEAVSQAAEKLNFDKSSIIIPLISNVLHCIINPDIKAFAIAIVSLLGQLGIVSMAMISQSVKVVTDFLNHVFARKVCSAQTPQEGTTLEPQSEDDANIAAASVASVIYSGVATMCSFSGSVPKDMTRFSRFLMRDLGGITKNANSLFIFIKNIFGLVQQCFYDVVGRIVPEYNLLKQLESSSEFIQTWAEHALKLIDPEYKRQNMQTPWYRNKVDSCWLEGSIIISRITGEAIHRKPLQALIKIFDQITRIREDLVAMGTHPTVRKEPFCIWVAGDRKVGKSYVSDEFCIRALERVGTVIKGNMKCVVNPMSDYWDMCTGTEPVLYIDDFFSVETDEYIGKQVATMFTVKTSAQLIPPMAALEDKKMRYAPDIFYISSNKAFINVPGLYLPAVHRRRDILIKAEAVQTPVHALCPHCIALENKTDYDLSTVPIEFLKDYHHIQFRVAKDVCDPATAWSAPYSFLDMCEIICTRYEAYNIAETERFQQRVNAYDRILEYPMDDVTVTDEINSKRRQMLELAREQNEGIWRGIKDHFQDEDSYWYKMWNKLKTVTAFEFQSNDFEMNPKDWLQASVDSMIAKKHMSKGMAAKIMAIGRKHELGVNDQEFWGVFECACAMRPVRTWFDFADNWCVSSKSDSFCAHARINPGKTDFQPTDQTFLYKKNIVPLACTSRCIFSAPFLEELFYTAMCETQRVYKNMVRSKMTDALPPFFKQAEDYRIDISNWKVVLREIIEDYFMKPLNSVARMMWKTLKTIWPLLTFIGLTLGLTHYSYVCAKDLAERQAAAAANSDGAQPLVGELVDQATRYGEAKTSTSTLVPKRVEPRAPVAQSAQTDNIANIVNKNVAYIRMDSSKGCKHVRILMIGDRVAILVRHYYEEWLKMGPETVYSFVKRVNDAEGPVIDVLKCKYKWIHHPGSDVTTSNIGVIYLPSVIPAYKNLVKYMAKTSDFPSHAGEVMLLDGETRTIIRGEFDGRVKYNIPGDEIISPVYMQECIRYNRQNRGMCGTVVLSTNLNRPIIGIHVAGMVSMNYGIAEPIVHETFERLPLCVNKELPHALPDADDKTITFVDSSIIREGKLGAQMAVHQPTRTKIRPSELHGKVFPVRTAPNPLSAYDPRLPEPISPLVSGVMKHGQPCKLFDEEKVKLVSSWLGARILSRVRPARGVCGVVSDQVAVCGDPQLKGYECMEFKTSPGWPLVRQKQNASGKKWCFDLDKTETGYILKAFHPSLEALIQVDQLKRKQGIVPTTMFIDCLKDTCIPVEKCSVPGKTRIFSISPVQYSVVFRKYFLDFVVAFQNARFDIFHAIGINVNSLEWTELAHRLAMKGRKILCGDYSNFGPQLSTQLVESLFQYILKWYEIHQTDRTNLEEDQRVRHSLLLELVNPFHIAHDLVYRVPTGIPSGSPITAPLNSLVNVLYILLAWLELVGSLDSFEEKSCCVVYGDDVIMSVTDDVAEIFNVETLHTFFKKYNITFTDADKSGNLIKYRDLTTATFLKCRFRGHDTRGHKLQLAALDPISIEGTVNWIKGTGIKDPMQATKINVESACRSAFGHGPAYFNEFRDKVVRAAAKCGLELDIPSWEELDSLWFSGELFL